jgi:hypothetical protein
LLFAAIGAAGSFYWVYSIRYIRPHPLQPGNREASGQEDLGSLRRSLRREMTVLDWAAGLKALTELEHEYEQLQALLGPDDWSVSLSGDYIRPLVNETFGQGLKVLSNALDLVQTNRGSVRQRLEQEIRDLEEEGDALRHEQSPVERVRYREQTINSHRERLSLLDQQQSRVEQLLYHVEVCEASLSRAYLELAALHAPESESSVGTVTHSLQSTIELAGKVQEELRQMGF